jgi:hypothetical protein
VKNSSNSITDAHGNRSAFGSGGKEFNLFAGIELAFDGSGTDLSKDVRGYYVQFLEITEHYGEQCGFLLPGFFGPSISWPECATYRYQLLEWVPIVTGDLPWAKKDFFSTPTRGKGCYLNIDAEAFYIRNNHSRFEEIGERLSKYDKAVPVNDTKGAPKAMAPEPGAPIRGEFPRFTGEFNAGYTDKDGNGQEDIVEPGGEQAGGASLRDMINADPGGFSVPGSGSHYVSVYWNYCTDSAGLTGVTGGVN